MNILHFLKSRIGAISKAGLVGTSITVGLMGVSMVNYMSSSQTVQDQKIRSLANIITSGGTIPQEYANAMQIDASRVPFATAEERAKREGTLFDGGEASVAALDKLNVSSNGGVEGVGPIEGRALGAGEAGLGMGANKVTEVSGGAGGVVHAAQKGDLSGVEGAAKDAASGPKLERASMARASGGSGGSFGSSSSSGGFGASGSVNSRSATQEKQSRISPIGIDSISGAMPGGSTLVARSAKFEGAHSSSFVGANGRRGHRVGGIDSAEGRNLKDIAVHSGKIAANAHRGTNEGADPFMAKQELSSGIALDDGTVSGTSFGGAGDESFGQLNDVKMDDLGAAVDDKAEYEAERKAKRTALVKELVALFFATIVAMCAISALMDKGTMICKAIAIVLGILMIAWIATYMARAGIFARDYDNDAAGIAFCVLAGIFAVGIAISFIPAVGQGIVDKILTPMADALGGSATSLGAGGAVSGIVEAGEGMISGSKELSEGDGSNLDTGNDKKTKGKGKK